MEHISSKALAVGDPETLNDYNEYLSEDKKLLDLTGNQLKDLAVVSIPSTLTELDLTTNRLSAIDPRVGQLSNLQKLSLRQNLITDSAASELSKYPPLACLRELVLRDNQLSKVPPVATFQSLTVLDLSYNEIKSLTGISQGPPTLAELYVANNAIPSIEEVSHLTALQLLELGSNKIRVIEGLEGLTSLKELWLGRNKIRQVALCGLTSLQKISLQSNRLTSMLGFEACRGLQELYLSHNGISRVEGLESLTQLRVLDIAANRISVIENLEYLTRLEDLWLNDNLIASLDGVETALAGCRETLTTLYLERNPLAKDPNYWQRLQDFLPNIQQIDAHMFS